MANPRRPQVLAALQGFFDRGRDDERCPKGAGGPHRFQGYPRDRARCLFCGQPAPTRRRRARPATAAAGPAVINRAVLRRAGYHSLKWTDWRDGLPGGVAIPEFGDPPGEHQHQRKKRKKQQRKNAGNYITGRLLLP